MMSSQPGDIAAGSRRSGVFGATQDVPRGGKFEKRAQSKRRFRNSFNKDTVGPSDSSAGQSNARHHTSSAQGGTTSDFSSTPSWFTTYMEEFKRQFVNEITEKINKHFDESRDDEAARRRHKTSYFLLKKRYAQLEEQLNDERVKNGDSLESTTFDRYKRTPRGGDERRNNQDDDDDDNKRHGYRRRGNYNGSSLNANDERKKDDDRKILRHDGIPTRIVDSPACESSTSNDSCDSVVQLIHDNNDSEKTIKSQEIIKADIHVDAENTSTIVDDSNKNTVDETNKNTDDGTNKNAELNTKTTDAKTNDKTSFTEKLDDILKDPVLHDAYTNNVTKKIELLNGDMTDDNIKELLEKLFEKIHEGPSLAEFYGNLISKIVNERPNYIKIQKVLIDVCNKQLDSCNYEKILLICGLYEQRLLSYEFMSKCIMKFMKFDNDNDNDCFIELLITVGENLSFWENSKLFEMLESIVDKDEVRDEKVIQQINRIIHTVKTSLAE